MIRHLLPIVLLSLSIPVRAQVIVAEKNGNIILSNNSTTTTIAATGDAISPVIYDKKVYYLQSAPTTVNSRITSYDIATKQYLDLVKVGMKSKEGYTIKSLITAMIMDTRAGLIYFTTKDIYEGQPVFLTWVYNVATGEYKVFCDGRVNNVDDTGNLTVIFDKRDEKGPFIQKAHFTPSRSLIKIDNKEYL